MAPIEIELVGAVAAGREHVRAVRHNQGVMACLAFESIVDDVTVDPAFDDAFSRNYDR